MKLITFTENYVYTIGSKIRFSNGTPFLILAISIKSNKYCHPRRYTMNFIETLILHSIYSVLAP